MHQFDCHAHVFDTDTAIPNARYVPDQAARLSTWLENLNLHGIKGGVLVQVSFLGTDNSQLCAALETLDPKRFAGVGVIPLNVADAELDRLVSAGIRGVRWNLVRGAAIPEIAAAPTQTFLSKLRARDLHLEVHLEGPRLGPLLPSLADQGVKIVIDHFGLPSEPQPKDDPMLRALWAIQDRSNLFFKTSAPYRTPFDLGPHTETLLASVGQDHIVWGSDWPHTQHKDITYTDVVGLTANNPHLQPNETAVQTLFGIQ
jgi:predicted TIM-barrel fold metal-dependent hydrolase